MPGDMAKASLGTLRDLHRDLGIPADYAARRGLKRQRPARALTTVGRNPEGGPVQLSPRAAAAWVRLRQAAARDGLVLLPLSGFRSVTRQTRIIRAKLAAGEKLPAILRLVAAPGYSEHHTGRALDIGSPDDTELDEHFAQTPAFRWLARHAGKYGYHLSFPRRNPHGIAYEPWHWCWRPIPAR